MDGVGAANICAASESARTPLLHRRASGRCVLSSETRNRETSLGIAAPREVSTMIAVFRVDVCR